MITELSVFELVQMQNFILVELIKMNDFIAQICTERIEKLLFAANNPCIPNFFSRHEIHILKNFCVRSLLICLTH